MNNLFKQRPLFFIFIFFTLGIILSSAFDLHYFAVSTAAFFLAIILYAFAGSDYLNPFAWLVLFLVFVSVSGMLRLSAQKGALSPAGIKGIYTFEGHIYSFKKSLPVVNLNKYISEYGESRISGLALVQKREIIENISMGDYICFTGNIVPSRNIYFNNFPYGKILNYESVKHIVYMKKHDSINILRRTEKYPAKRLIFDLRKSLSHIIDKHVPYPQSAQSKALLFGLRGEIPKHTIQDYRLTGTSHILAISGAHVGLMAVVLYVVFSAFRFSLSANRMLSIAGLLFYCTLAGMSPSVLRATIIASLYLLGYLLKEESDPLNSLGAAGLIILLYNPYDTFKCGYILSFVSVFSIILILPIANASRHQIVLFKKKSFLTYTAGYMFDSVKISAAAWLGVMPIIAYYFNIWTPGGLIANLYTIPLTFAAISSSLCVIVFNFIWPGSAGIFGYSAAFFIQANNFLNSHFARIKGMYFEVESISTGFIAAYYLFYLTFLLFLYFLLKTKKSSLS